MTSIDYSSNNPDLAQLQNHFLNLKDNSIGQIIDGRPNQDDFILSGKYLHLDMGRNFVERTTFHLLKKLLESRNFSSLRNKLFNGEIVNIFEHKSADHIALRNCSGNIYHGSPEILSNIQTNLKKIQTITELVHNKKASEAIVGDIEYVVHIGIGGSDLGPRLVVDALDEFKSKKSPEIFFLSSVDPYQFNRVFSRIKPEKTLFIIVSKSFKTPETQIIAEQCIKTLNESGVDYKKRFIIVSANPNAAKMLNIHPDNFLSFPDTIGGRYSLWSATGLVISIFLGFDGFSELLKGASEMDEHFLNAPLSQNMPVATALLDFWYTNFFHSEFYSVNPYTERLNLLPDYLQQLIMESNGKSCNINGEPVTYPTATAIIGGTGTASQHSYFQALHQGTHFFHMDFIGLLETPDQIKHAEIYDFLFSNLVAQSHTMSYGHKGSNKDPLAPYREIPGNRPCNHIFIKKWNPASLGNLLALYEHKTFVSGILWEIDSFDQWGVERGKVICNEIQRGLKDKNNSVFPDNIAKNHILLYQGRK